MYSKPTLALKYIRYYLTAANGKGHGIHSPFVFDFVTHILNDTRSFYAFEKIESVRGQLLLNKDRIDVEDYGAGSAVMSSRSRIINHVAHWSLKSPKYAQLLFRIVDRYQPQTIVELGTSLGITTAYLSSANPKATVYTFEGAPAIASIATNNFSNLGLSNIILTRGNFDHTLQPVLQKLSAVDFAFIDGNHREEPVLHYFEWLLPYAKHGSVFIFDDIHWSAGMEAAWQKIKAHPAVTCSIDLFFIGIIFFNKDFKVKQDFTIRY